VSAPAPSLIPSSSSRSASSAPRRGSQPSSSRRARRVHERHAQREVEPSRRGRLQPQPPARRRQPAGEARRQLDRPRAEDLGERPGIEHLLRCDVERPADVADDSEPVGLADVERVHRLEAQARDARDDREPAGPHERNGPAKRRLMPAAASRSKISPERSRTTRSSGRSRSSRSSRRVGVRLVPRVEARRDAERRPALVDPPVLRPRRVRADRRGVHERTDTGLGRRPEDAVAAEHVDAPELVQVVRRLDRPREVDDGVGAAEERHEVVPRRAPALDASPRSRRNARLSPRSPAPRLCGTGRRSASGWAGRRAPGRPGARS